MTDSVFKVTQLDIKNANRMNDGANKVVIVEGFQNNLNVSLEKPRFCEEASLIGKWLTAGFVRFAFSIQFVHWALKG